MNRRNFKAPYQLQELGFEANYLYEWLASNPRCPVWGVFELVEEVGMLETKMPRPAWGRARKELEGAQVIVWEASTVLIVDCLAGQPQFRTHGLQRRIFGEFVFWPPGVQKAFSLRYREAIADIAAMPPRLMGSRSVSFYSEGLRRHFLLELDRAAKGQAVSPQKLPPPVNPHPEKTLPATGAQECYKAYPTKCPIRAASNGKSSKHLVKIEKILKDGYPLLRAIRFYVAECERNQSFMKNFGTFLNNLPDMEEVEKWEANPSATPADAFSQRAARHAAQMDHPPGNWN